MKIHILSMSEQRPADHAHIERGRGASNASADTGGGRNQGGMNRLHTLSGWILAVARAAILAFLILAFNSGIWGALLISNLSTTPAIPWAVPIMALFLWLMWQYLNGKWWPRSTSETRHQLLRARPVSGQVFAWALLTGVLSIVALTGYWIVMFKLFKMSGNVLPDLSRSPLLTAALVLVMASLVSPLSEEAAFRGYAQSILERAFRGPASPIILSSVLFALAHLTQGFFLPKLFVYFLAGVMIGGVAYVTRSILPGIAAHILTDLTFFTLVWPYDTQRRLIWETGVSDTWFWIHLAQAIIFTVLALLAFIRLARVAKRTRAIEGNPIPAASADEPVR
jgi:membrane protease YdiL (CAAX protease family)